MKTIYKNDDYEYVPPVLPNDTIEGTIPDIPVTYKFSLENVKWFADNSKSNQSAASYGDYLVLIPQNRPVMHLYNLRTKALLYSLPMKAGTGGSLYHCNQATFGVDFYEKGDSFPLLYISQRNRALDKRCFIEVFRLLPSRNEEYDDYTSMQAQLVQTILLPPMTYDNSLGNANCVIETETKSMYTYSRNNEKGQDNTGVCKITRFVIPEIYKDTVMLEDSDIQDSYMLDCSAVNMQGGCIEKSILYIGQGYKSAGYIYLNVVDLKRRQLLERIDLLERGITWEPEGCFFYKGNLMIAEGTNIWEFIFAK